MITRFKEFLYDEIVTMMMSQELVRAPSRQSISNSSTGSQTDEPPVSTYDENERANFVASVPADLYVLDEPDYQLDDYQLDEEPDEIAEGSSKP
jgi:hypothetical protein